MLDNEMHNNKPAKWRMFLLIFMVFIIMPLTVFFGWKYASRRYYLISVILIVYSMIPFFLIFEHRSPKAREIVVLAVLCAIAVTSRACFIWIPHFKPMTAIILITGAALGSQSGFVCGVMSGFVSNFLFGQGPWTPWQMFAYGVAGFLAGMVYYGKKEKPNKITFAMLGMATVVLLVGPILDTYSLFSMVSNYTMKSVGLIYLSGLPVNIIHGLATSLCILLVSDAMFEQLNRLKIKYGVMEDRDEF